MPQRPRRTARLRLHAAAVRGAAGGGGASNVAAVHGSGAGLLASRCTRARRAIIASASSRDDGAARIGNPAMAARMAGGRRVRVGGDPLLARLQRDDRLGAQRAPARRPPREPGRRSAADGALARHARRAYQALGVARLGRVPGRPVRGHHHARGRRVRALSVSGIVLRLARRAAAERRAAVHALGSEAVRWLPRRRSPDPGTTVCWPEPGRSTRASFRWRSGAIR